MDQVSIDKIELKIGKKTIPLSLEEAKELKRVLEQLFPAPVAIPIPYCPPVIVAPTPWRPWWHGEYWCSNDAKLDQGVLSLSCN